MALRSVEEIEVILDTFLCMLHSTASAVTGDADVVRVNRFQMYLLTVVVLITTISHNLGLEIQDVNTTGPSVAVCQRIIGDMIQRVGFLQELPQSERVPSLLNRFINEKIEKIQTKLDQYIQLTDFMTNACQHEC